MNKEIEGRMIQEIKDINARILHNVKMALVLGTVAIIFFVEALIYDLIKGFYFPAAMNVVVLGLNIYSFRRIWKNFS
jgi:hypothetical protein